MNHELGNVLPSEPNVGGALNRGAFVSRFILDKTGMVLSGERAYDTVYNEETGAVLPAPEVGNTTPGFGRFCSASLSYQEAGFDRPIYFTNEESGPTQVFDPKGALAWAVFDKEIHSLVKHGRFAWENALVRPDAGELTVVMGMEDGTSQSRPQYASRAREGSIWRHDLKNEFAATRIVELNPPGTAIAVGQTAPPAVGAGIWETSGIIDSSDFFGKDSWLFVV